MKKEEMPTCRIDQKTRELILADFWLFEKDDLNDIVKSFKPKDFSYHATALCLYSCLIFTGLHENNIESLHPDFHTRELLARRDLKALPKYATLPKKQFHERIKEICLRETRNCFSHGAFEIMLGETVEQSYFVLSPNQSEITNSEKIYVSFASVYNSIASHQIDIAEEILKKDDFFSYSLSNRDEMFHKIIVPSVLTELADFYAGKITKISQSSVSDPKMWIYLNNIFLTTQLSYNQNDFHELFGADSEVFKAVAYIRNSFLHHYTTFTDDGKKQVLENHYKSNSSSIESDISEITLKLEILKAEKELKVLKDDSSIGDTENLLKKEASIDELIKMLTDTFVSTYGEKIEELAKNYEVPNTFEYEFPKKPEKDEKTPDKK